VTNPPSLHASRLTPHAPVGLLGGTFDPIHFGHLRLAEELADTLDVARVHIVPAGDPYHRDAPRTPLTHRVAMARLAVSGNPRFLLDERETLRAGPSYAVDTLAELRAEYGPQTPLWLFLGGDAFLGLAQWHDWRRLFDLAHIAVAHRPGFRFDRFDLLPEALKAELASRRDADRNNPSGALLLQPVTQLAISSSALRDLLDRGASARYLLPDAVLEYIHAHRLYR
jgi:nicotinate-nucleotide adenylyltransferase